MTEPVLHTPKKLPTPVPPPAEPANSLQSTSSISKQVEGNDEEKPFVAKEECSDGSALTNETSSVTPAHAQASVPPVSRPSSSADASTATSTPPVQASTSADGVEPRRIGKKATVWVPEVKEVLWRAVDLIPNIGRSRYDVRGKPMDRFEMISEYIRRQSGYRRTVQQIRNFRSNLKYGLPEDSEGECNSLLLEHRLTFVKRLAGSYIDSSVAASIDWDAFLGPDLHPATASAVTSNAQPLKKRKRDASSSPPPTSTDTIADKRAPVHAVCALASPFTQSPFSSQPIYQPLQQAPSGSSFPSTQQPQTVHFLPPPSSGMLHRHPTQPTTQPQPRIDFRPALRAFFAAVMPDRDLALLVNHLASAGLTSVDQLSDLLLMDEGSVDGFIERIPKLGGVERAFLRKAILAAKASFESLT
ncbi:Transketolase [Rhodotorula toruloides]